MSAPAGVTGRDPAALAPAVVLWRDAHYLICDKPSGLLVHPSDEAPRERTLMHAARAAAGCWVNAVHRLDRAASGIVVFGLTGEAVAALQARWADEATVKEYWALVRGETPAQGLIDRPLTDDRGVAQGCRTHFATVATTGKFSLVAVRLESGRRHQIRRHFAGLAHHLAGDTKYGKGGINRGLRADVGLGRLFLHARRLAFDHPFTGARIDVRSPLPADLEGPLMALGFRENDFTNPIAP